MPNEGTAVLDVNEFSSVLQTRRRSTHAVAGVNADLYPSELVREPRLKFGMSINWLIRDRGSLTAIAGRLNDLASQTIRPEGCTCFTTKTQDDCDHESS